MQRSTTEEGVAARAQRIVGEGDRGGTKENGPPVCNQKARSDPQHSSQLQEGAADAAPPNAADPKKAPAPRLDRPCEPGS